MAQNNWALAIHSNEVANSGRPAKESDGLSGGQLLPCNHVAVPSASAWSHRTLCEVSLGLVSTQLLVQGMKSNVGPRRGFILEPGSCSRRCSTAAIMLAPASGACAGTHTWSGQDRRREGTFKEGRMLGLARRSLPIFIERRRVRCRSGSPAGSDRVRERAETRGSRQDSGHQRRREGQALVKLL
jgi:hypothetical protein